MLEMEIGTGVSPLISCSCPRNCRDEQTIMTKGGPSKQGASH